MRLLGWGLIVLAIVGVTVVANLPAPYVIEEPGPVFDVLGDVDDNGQQVQMIQIPSQQTYPTAGALDMLTVSITGNRDSLPTWLDVVQAYADPSKAVTPVDDIYPPGQTVQQSNQEGEVDMQNSQKEAIAAALHNLGYSFPSTLTVDQTEAGGPSDGVLLAGDVILSLDGNTFADVPALRAGIAANGTATPATIEIMRAGQKLTVQVTPKPSSASDPTPILGIIVGSDYQFPFPVTIQLQNVGGPSAGMMFALGIIDKLTPGDLNGGQKVAGTGTIDSSGAVGAIGGIRQKLYGARAAGATYFLAPSSNCDEVTGHIPAGLKVFAVSTLSDSLAALKDIESGADTSSLPTCSVK